jgi:small subunit ribosomal protein S20
MDGFSSLGSWPVDQSCAFGYNFWLDCVISFVEETMPNIKSAKKRMELSRVANTRNRAKRSRIRTAIRRVKEAEDAAVAQERLREAVALLDRASTKNIIPANRAARLKSQLARKVNELSAVS